MKKKTTESSKLADTAKKCADKMRGIDNFIPPVNSSDMVPPIPKIQASYGEPGSYVMVPAADNEPDILIVLSGIAMAAGFVALGMAMR